MTTIADKEKIRKSLKNLVLEESNLMNDLTPKMSEDLKKFEENRLGQIIKKNFEEYDEVFRALA
jgi:hypothetical protein